MYLPAATVAAVMAMENTVDDKVLAIRPEVTSTTASSIYIRWALEGMGSGLPKGFVVQYNRIASNYFQYSEMLEPSTETYGIKNLVADTYYKVISTFIALRIFYSNVYKSFLKVFFLHFCLFSHCIKKCANWKKCANTMHSYILGVCQNVCQ